MNKIILNNNNLYYLSNFLTFVLQMNMRKQFSLINHAEQSEQIGMEHLSDGSLN